MRVYSATVKSAIFISNVQIQREQSHQLVATIKNNEVECL